MPYLMSHTKKSRRDSILVGLLFTTFLMPLLYEKEVVPNAREDMRRHKEILSMKQFSLGSLRGTITRA